MNITHNNIIGELVAKDYRAAEVFAKYGIDFCCKGGLSLQAVSEKKNISLTELIDDLKGVTASTEPVQNDYLSWPIDLLTDYIEKTHHRYVVAKTPVIQQYLTKVCQVHGKAHPELHQVLEEFNQSAQALAVHMKKEELILFPYVRKMMKARENELLLPHFGTVENPIAMMKHEHNEEGERFRRISALSSNYTPPEGACNTYKVTYALLKEFENDLHLHIHLENNILFPRAIKMEADLRAQSMNLQS